MNRGLTGGSTLGDVGRAVRAANALVCRTAWDVDATETRRNLTSGVSAGQGKDSHKHTRRRTVALSPVGGVSGCEVRRYSEMLGLAIDGRSRLVRGKITSGHPDEMEARKRGRYASTDAMLGRLVGNVFRQSPKRWDMVEKVNNRHPRWQPYMLGRCTFDIRTGAPVWLRFLCRGQATRKLAVCFIYRRLRRIHN